MILGSDTGNWIKFWINGPYSVIRGLLAVVCHFFVGVNLYKQDSDRIKEPQVKNSYPSDQDKVSQNRVES